MVVVGEGKESVKWLCGKEAQRTVSIRSLLIAIGRARRLQWDSRIWSLHDSGRQMNIAALLGLKHIQHQARFAHMSTVTGTFHFRPNLCSLLLTTRVASAYWQWPPARPRTLLVLRHGSLGSVWPLTWTSDLGQETQYFFQERSRWCVV